MELQQCGEAWEPTVCNDKILLDFIVLGYFKHLLKQVGQ